jgi:uncharacterized protein (TIGR03083 family)
VYVEALRSDGAALAAAARSGVQAPVPSCPAWTVADLVRHTGRLHRWVTDLVRTHASERPPRDDNALMAADEQLASWFEEGAGLLAEVLSSADDDEPAWNWSVDRPHTASFWKRRMAHETSVHRWDGQLAHGVPEPIAPVLAKDGIDEMVETFLPLQAASKPTPALGGSLHLHTTDVEGEWLVRAGEGKAEVSYSHGKGDAAVRGTAEDVLLFVWGRKAPEELETFGDPAVVANWALFTR